MADAETKTQRLQVAILNPAEGGRGIARLPTKAMEALGLAEGDVIEIIGKRSTAARAIRPYDDDHGLDIIRLDGLQRANAGVGSSDFVEVRKAKSKPATRVVFAPAANNVRLQGSADALKRSFLGRPLTAGDTVATLGHQRSTADMPENIRQLLNAPAFSLQEIRMTVVSAAPRGIVHIAPETIVELLAEYTEKVGERRADVTYDDLGGMRETVDALREMVELPLRHPELFQRLGVDPPKGVLLYGPPGCGKTMIAKAVANSAGSHFLNIKGPELLDKFVGETERQIRAIFTRAKEHATSGRPVIVFFDEMDALFRTRGSGISSDVEATIVPQLLSEIDGVEGTHDAAITASLVLGDPTELAAAEGRLHAALVQQLRALLAAVEASTDDHYATWDEAHCIWDGGLRGIAIAADAVGWTRIDEQIAADIDAGFAAGHDGILGEPPTSGVDDWQVPPNKQRVEKSLYRAIQRVIVELATRARDHADPAAARRALELLASIESRLDGRNTPGIAQLHAILGGDPALIDPAAVLLELDIAFAKRTRTYASSAIDNDELGVPGGYEGAVEGGTYAKLIAAGMTGNSSKVADLDLAAYLDAWDRYAVLVRAGTELDELAAVSRYLVDTTCAYQAALGVASCSSDVDETK